MHQNSERAIQVREELRWVVVSGENSDIGFPESISNITINMLANKRDVNTPLAYDVEADLLRYEELCHAYGESQAEAYLREEMRFDMISHFSELGSKNNRVKLYEYEYVIGNDGNLRESEGEMDLVSNMFLGQEKEVLGGLWMSHIIPFLEDAKVGQSAFTLSVKADSVFEGAYDFSYFMLKIDENTVKCVGVELDLSREEQMEVINSQLIDQEAPSGVLLKEDFNWKEARGRAIFYDSGRHLSFEEMYISVVGSQILKMRSEYELGSGEQLKSFLELERQKVRDVICEAEDVVVKMMEKIVSRESYGGVENDLMMAQINHLMKNDPELLWEARDVGYVVLACGLVDIGGEDLSNNLSVNEKSWSYHNGNCVNCKSCNVEVGPCNICKACEKKFDDDKK